MLSLNLPEGELCELQYADYLVLLSETVEELWDMIVKWKEAFESKCFNINLWKTNVMVSSMSEHKVDPSVVCNLRVKSSSVLRVQFGKWIHGRCAGVKRVTPKFSGYFICQKCEGNIAEAVEQEEKLCDEVETVGEFTYHGDMVSAGGGCEAAVTARTRCGWIEFRECGELLFGRRFSLWLWGIVI